MSVAVCLRTGVCVLYSANYVLTKSRFSSI
jgi:hypothetical protein